MNAEVFRNEGAVLHDWDRDKGICRGKDKNKADAAECYREWVNLGRDGMEIHCTMLATFLWS